MTQKKSNTTVFEKLGASIVNVLVALAIFSPFYFVVNDVLMQKLLLIGIFFLVTLLALFFNNNRGVGMTVMDTSYVRKRISLKRHFVYNVLYTLSFATLLFSFYFPFDLFLFNMLVIQLPTIYFTGTTMHGLLAGYVGTQ